MEILGRRYVYSSPMKDLYGDELPCTGHRKNHQGLVFSNVWLVKNGEIFVYTCVYIHINIYIFFHWGKITRTLFVSSVIFTLFLYKLEGSATRGKTADGVGGYGEIWRES